MRVADKVAKRIGICQSCGECISRKALLRAVTPLLCGLLLGWALALSGVGDEIQRAVLGRQDVCNYTVSDWMRERVHLLCLVSTQPHSKDTAAAAVRDTWGTHCDHLLFLSTQPDPVVSTIVVNQSVHSWSRILSALQFIVNNHSELQYDWILNTNDKTFVVVENLRRLLYMQNSLQPWLTAGVQGDDRLRPEAGFVLSREAARKVVADGRHDPNCLLAQDVRAGLVFCAVAVNATFLSAVDRLNLPLFYNRAPDVTIADLLEGKQDDACCSQQAVTFSGLNHSEIRAIYYLLHQLKPSMKKYCL